jgi:hypothetical protein
MSVARFLNIEADPLAYYAQADFERLVGATLTLTAVDSTTALAQVTLTALQDLLPADADRSSGREEFHLVLTTDADQAALDQNVYRFEHRELGAIQLFLVPASLALVDVNEAGTTAAGDGFVTSSDTGEVADASVFAADDVVKLEDGTTIGTVESIDLEAEPNTVTLVDVAEVDVETGLIVKAEISAFQIWAVGPQDDGSRSYRAILNRLRYSAMGSEAAQLMTWPLGASRFNQERQQTI